MSFKDTITFVADLLADSDFQYILVALDPTANTTAHTGRCNHADIVKALVTVLDKNPELRHVIISAVAQYALQSGDIIEIPQIPEPSQN